MALAEHLERAIKKHAMGKRGVEKADKAGAKLAGPGDVDEMTIKKAENGFLVTHHKDGDGMRTGYKKPEHHVFDHTGHHTTSGDDFHEHIQKFMGCYEPAEAASGEVSKSETRRGEGGKKVHEFGKDTKRRVI